MLLKLVHYFVLLCYLNILAYEVGSGTAPVVSSPILNGESILEFVLEDVLSIPIDKSSDIQIRYDEYRVILNYFLLLPLFVLLVGFVFSTRLLGEKARHPVYDGKKRHIVPGYYKYLHRLKLY
ncbi:hypothetical protein HP439_00630 [Sphingobacterium shayense]|uniref:hypothetical protein n=1 Tax=Sphingobacterium shayense TaxID=626343 RepID=UPI001555B109|nr:hypothetical protein [Sphingobacterium shayense]NQD69225.1 hypothetical protein [Sphingobacterium shayense]